jgi:hypothetical protein
VHRLVGHRSTDATTLYYTGLSNAPAVAAYQERVLERRGRLRRAGEGAAVARAGFRLTTVLGHFW